MQANDNIHTVVHNNTASNGVTINISKDGEVMVEKIDNIANPQTGDYGIGFVLLYVTASVLLSIAFAIIRRKLDKA